MSRLIFAGLGLLWCTGLLLTGCAGSKSVAYSGQLEATTIRILAPVAGPIHRFPLQEGDKIVTGALVILVKSGMRVNLSIPQHKELSVGTLRALIRNSGLSVEAFLKLI